MMNFGLQALGGGAGLRHAHFDEILKTNPQFRWLEVINEDFMEVGGRERELLLDIASRYPIVGHGVCMSLGTPEPLDMQYLKNLKDFLDEVSSPWTSDHLCFTMVDHTNLNELIPLPFTSEAVDTVAAKVRVAQDVLERPFLVENVTRYITVSDREMSEAEFITSVLEKADCGLLLDITNVHLNSMYHGYDAFEFIRSLPLERVGQMHLAGSKLGPDGEIIDSHDAPVCPEVWDLFRKTIELTGSTSVLIEWDKSLPPAEQLLAEAQMAEMVMEDACRRAA